MADYTQKFSELIRFLTSYICYNIGISYVTSEIKWYHADGKHIIYFGFSQTPKPIHKIVSFKDANRYGDNITKISLYFGRIWLQSVEIKLHYDLKTVPTLALGRESCPIGSRSKQKGFKTKRTKPYNNGHSLMWEFCTHYT